MRYVIILSLLILAAGLLYWRLRPYLLAARRIMNTVRDAQRMAERPPEEFGTTRREGSSTERLVRCAACGIWHPCSRGLKLPSSGANYCSHACLESAAGAGRNNRKATG